MNSFPNLYLADRFIINRNHWNALHGHEVSGIDVEGLIHYSMTTSANFCAHLLFHENNITRRISVQQFKKTKIIQAWAVTFDKIMLEGVKWRILDFHYCHHMWQYLILPYGQYLSLSTPMKISVHTKIIPISHATLIIKSSAALRKHSPQLLSISVSLIPSLRFGWQSSMWSKI